MNTTVSGFMYLFSWVLMGLGVFLAFRVAADLRRAMQQRAIGQQRMLVASGSIRIALIALVVLVSVGVTYAGAYTAYNLMVGG